MKADGSPNRDEMLHPVGAGIGGDERRARMTRRGGQHRGMGGREMVASQTEADDRRQTARAVRRLLRGWARTVPRRCLRTSAVGSNDRRIRHKKGLANRQAMRNGQNKRMRGRNNHRKSHNPMARVYESNGPDVKISARSGPISHRREIHPACARRAGLRRSGRGRELLPARRALFPPDRRGAGAVPPEQSRTSVPRTRRGDDDSRDDGDERSRRGEEDARRPSRSARASRSLICRASAAFRTARQQHQPHPAAAHQPRRRAARGRRSGDVDRLPSFITGGAPQQQQPSQTATPEWP